MNHTLTWFICSNKPRASTSTGGPYWTRDTHHIKGENGKTLCGRKAEGWLEMGDMEGTGFNGDLCAQCRKIHNALLKAE